MILDRIGQLVPTMMMSTLFILLFLHLFLLTIIVTKMYIETKKLSYSFIFGLRNT